jgi:hypothetical protein
MKFKPAFKLIEKAAHERNMASIFKVYLVDRQHQLYLVSNGVIKPYDVISFNDYYTKSLPQTNTLDNRSADEIMEEIMQLKFEG